MASIHSPLVQSKCRPILRNSYAHAIVLLIGMGFAFACTIHVVSADLLNEEVSSGDSSSVDLPNAGSQDLQFNDLPPSDSDSSNSSNSTDTPTTGSTASSKSNVIGAAVGGAVGGFVGILLLILVGFLIWKYCCAAGSAKRNEEGNEVSERSPRKKTSGKSSASDKNPKVQRRGGGIPAPRMHNQSTREGAGNGGTEVYPMGELNLSDPDMDRQVFDPYEGRGSPQQKQPGVIVNRRGEVLTVGIAPTTFSPPIGGPRRGQGPSAAPFSVPSANGSPVGNNRNPLVSPLPHAADGNGDPADWGSLLRPGALRNASITAREEQSPAININAMSSSSSLRWKGSDSMNVPPAPVERVQSNFSMLTADEQNRLKKLQDSKRPVVEFGVFVEAPQGSDTDSLPDIDEKPKK